MLNWNTASILEKNKLSNSLPFIVLVEVSHSSLTTPLYLCRNNENITWRGQEYTAFPIDFTSVTEDGSELPSVTMKVSAVGGMISTLIQQYSGFTDAEVTIYVVHAGHLDATDADLELNLVCSSCSYDEQWVSFTLEGNKQFNYRFPPNRYLQDYCKFHFKDVRCGYAGNEEACSNTLSTCRIKERFGGEPGVSSQ